MPLIARGVTQTFEAAGILCYEVGMSGHDMRSSVCQTANPHLHAV